MLTGLNLSEALASLPAGADRELARGYLVAAEAAFMAAFLKRYGGTGAGEK